MIWKRTTDEYIAAILFAHHLAAARLAGKLRGHTNLDSSAKWLANQEQEFNIVAGMGFRGWLWLFEQSLPPAPCFRFQWGRGQKRQRPTPEQTFIARLVLCLKLSNTTVDLCDGPDRLQ